MGQFQTFSRAVKNQFDRMSLHELHTVDATDLWEAYLAAFPAGTNEIYRVRAEHDCSCCRSFVRQVGHVVRLTPDGVETVWDDGGLPEPYRTVASRLIEIVRQLPVTGVWRTKQPRYGAETTRELDGASVISWHHFNCEVARKHQSREPDAERGRLGTNAQVFRRGLETITEESLDTALELIEAGSLYRGTEAKQGLEWFRRHVRAYSDLTSESERAHHVWTHAGSPGALIRNTAIGTFLTDLSEGTDEERAVKSYETKVAPQNYKRPTALVTQKTIDAALQKLRDLGLDTAIHRRHARLSDVSVRDVLWVDSGTRSALRDPLADLMSGAATKKVTARGGDSPEVPIDEFLSRIVPGAKSLAVQLENRQLGNFVSLTAPADADAPPLFKWPSGVAWSYDGDVTDSVRERVKRAGGNVDAPLRVSLAWYNYDDLDIHVQCPDGHVYFGDKMGILDVDMNAGGGRSREAVENLSWRRPRDGVYQVWVNQFSRRESIDVGFEMELWDGKETKSWSYDSAVSRDVPCLAFEMRAGIVTNLKVMPSLKEGSATTVKWGVPTGVEVPVTALMHSPNHWGEASVGARHTIFALKDCLAPDPVRGMYNEFLRPDLAEHRKVLEVLGSRTKAPYSGEQISGVGFTIGRGDSVRVRVGTDESSRVYTVGF